MKSIKIICCATVLCMTFICNGMAHHIGPVSTLSGQPHQILKDVNEKIAPLVAKVEDAPLIRRFFDIIVPKRPGSGTPYMEMQIPTCAVDTDDEKGVEMLQTMLKDAHMSSNIAFIEYCRTRGIGLKKEDKNVWTIHTLRSNGMPELLIETATKARNVELAKNYVEVLFSNKTKEEVQWFYGLAIQVAGVELDSSITNPVVKYFEELLKTQQ